VRALKDIRPLSDKLTQTAYQIKHRNIIEILSSHERDIPFCIVLEYINGITLDHLLEVGYFPKRDTISIVRQLCDALYYLQNLGIDHKNLRPTKIIIDYELKPVISVFEIFKDLRGFTRLDKIKDDLVYSSPEELRKEPTELDYDKVNQFLMGLIIYEMLTGKALFSGENVEEVMESRKLFFEKPTHRRALLKSANLAPDLAKIIHKLLEVEPEKRFSNLVELEKALYRLPIHGERNAELVHESYMRCCAKNRDFISSFYNRLFTTYPDRDYAARFGGEKVSNRTRKKLRVMILQLIDVENPMAPVSFSRIKAFSSHVGLERQDFHNFLQTLRTEVEANDFMWMRDPDIAVAWESAISRAIEIL
jgi:serine/threonine protein kinase